MGDLLRTELVALLLVRDDVEAVLNAGLPVTDVPKTALEVAGTGVLMATEFELFSLDKTGLRLQLLFRIGVNLGFDGRVSRQLDIEFELFFSFSVSELLMLLLFRILGPLCSLMSSNDVLLVTENKI